MSKAVIPIATVALEDPVTRLGRPTAWGVPQGGIVYTYQQVNANTTQSTSAGNINFVCPPPSPEIIVDRRVMVEATMNLTFQCIPLAGMPVLQLGTNDGLRAFPLMQSINTVSATINNNTITALMDPIIALMRLNMPFSLQQQDYTGTPNMLDQYQEYDFWNGIPQASLPAWPYDFQVGGGSARNPLSSYGESLVAPSRGGFLMQVVANPVGDGINSYTAGIILKVVEPIFMTPFAQWGEEPGFYGIQTLNINFTLNSTWWNRVWSSNFNKVLSPAIAAAPGTLIDPAAGSANFSNLQILGQFPAGSPRLLFRYITPSPIKTLPPLMEYPYTSIQVFTTATNPVSTPSVFNTVAANSPVISSSLQFNTIPDQIVVYLFRAPGNRNHMTSDTFASISTINVSFMNQTGLLASASQWDLYAISKRNGYIGTFDQWRWLTGSVLILKPGLDLGLEPSLAPGMNGLYNFQISVTFANPSAAAVNYLLYVVPLTSGLVTIKDNGTVTQTGIITRADVLAAQAAPSLGYQEAVKMVGGDFFSGLKSILSRGADFVSPVLGAVGNAANVIATPLSMLHPGAGAIVGNIGRYANMGNNYLGQARKKFGFGMYGAGFQGSGGDSGRESAPGSSADPGYLMPEYTPGYSLDPSMDAAGAQQHPYYDQQQQFDDAPQYYQAPNHRRQREEENDGAPPVVVSRRRMESQQQQQRQPIDPREAQPQFR